jgi:adenosylmethionine-8-amino-7-oxononanoate aminotransferase
VGKIESVFRDELLTVGARAGVRIAGALAAVDGAEARDAPGPARAAAGSGSGAHAESLFGRLLARGILTVPGGLSGTTCSLLPAFTIQEEQLRSALRMIAQESS